MSIPFTMRQRLRFAHCDPAGIAYYPRYFELADHVIEEWTENVLGVPRRELHMRLGLALPTVHLEAEFAAVSRLGDWLDFALRVEEVGKSSVGLALGASCGEELRFSVRYRQVLVEMEGMKSMPWPDEWRRHLEAAA